MKMKKLHLVAFAAIIAAMLVGCGKSGNMPAMGDDIDTLSYAFGVAQTKGLKPYLSGRLNVDTAYMSQFLKGVKDGMNSAGDKKKSAYLAGVQIGQQIGNQMVPGLNNELFGEDSTRSISVKHFMKGFNGAVMGKDMGLSQDDAMTLFRTKMEAAKSRVLLEQFGDNKAAGEKFLAENAKKPDVKTLPSGVQYRVIKEGNGPVPADSSTVMVNYEGRLLNDTVFDSSYRRGQPAKFAVKRVIPGWTDALQHMPVGSEWEIYVPQDLAYGERRQPNIDPYSMLIFKLELLEIVDTNKK